jgi:hypothetical protein
MPACGETVETIEIVKSAPPRLDALPSRSMAPFARDLGYDGPDGSNIRAGCQDHRSRSR